LYPLWSIRLSPMVAAAAMALSSLSVVGNAGRLRRWHLQTQAASGQAGAPPAETHRAHAGSF
ncbi:MAG: hypothetical protein ACRDOO_10340, partial [Actinomadura sp.]